MISPRLSKRITNKSLKSTESEITFADPVGAVKAMADARKAAAVAAPTNVTTWPKDDAARAAFQAKVRASQSSPQQSVVTHVETDYWNSWQYYYDKIRKEMYPVYTPENPRRSRRIATNPKVAYFK